MKVFINPGHAPEGNPDPRACNVYTGFRECDVAAEVGSLTAHYLPVYPLCWTPRMNGIIHS